ncbi:WxL domain-containing protein [Companilactobacillus mishanensis]|uniref:WxL domain-containing protein n=1 Tax=Companilactobacillus mishanensis TaxID=2486008 RepID=A0A5P0ZHM2_9LACO|nr:WxL domain-containing protein [Companilactobacillus mishanensis]MQS52492.1 hypothetical protein [Companilactobacillus mishanensis]
MKISKTKLAGSLALAGIVLGAVAPTTVQAATGNTLDGDKASTEISTNLNLNNNDTVIANDKATAESEANVQIISGFLTLDMVPDFSFGSVIAGGTAGLRSKGVSTIDNDGNSQGILQVTETRENKTENAANKGLGFTVSAELAGFKLNGKDDPVKGFTLNLASQTLKDADGKIVDGQSTNAATLDDNNKTATIMSMNAGSYNKGQIKATFDNSKAAELKVPQIASEKGQKAYSSVITWTLNAKAADAGSHA